MSNYNNPITNLNNNPNLISGTYDPTRQIPMIHQTAFKPTPGNGHGRISINTTPPHSGIPSQNDIHEKIIEKISDKIFNHFKIKYPTTIEASGFNIKTISQVVGQIIKRGGNLDERGISKIIDIIDHKFKTTIHSQNRQGVQYDTTTNFAMDKGAHISIDKYLENYTNKVSILLDSDKAVAAELPKNMGPSTDMTNITKPEPFSEDFPIRDRERQTDLMVPEVRAYDYYITIDSKDRDPTKYPDPNEFVIDFSPAPPAAGETRKGYIDRGFGNIKSCELMNVVIRDTSTQSDSSDAGGISYPYLLLQFDELQNNFFGTNDNISRTFAILAEYNKIGDFKYYRLFGDSSENTVIRVYNPRINLNKITTRLLLPNGTLFNFGSAFTNDTSNTCITTSFRMTTIQKNLATQFIDKATY
jgi:hypothetical protein